MQAIEGGTMGMQAIGMQGRHHQETGGGRRNSNPLRLGAILGALLVGSILILGCSGPTGQETNVTVPPDAPLKQLRSEAILSTELEGLTAEPPVELPADAQLEYTNAISRRYIATDDESLIQAAQQIYDAAIADGWTGEPPSDPGSSGVFGTTLEKGEMSLDLSYQTSESFDLLDTDVDELALMIVISTRSTDLSD